MEKIFLPNEKTTLRVYPGLAMEIGLNESLLLLQLEFWIDISTTDTIDGKRWTYQSLGDIRKEAFPFWSRDKINRTIKSLLQKGLISEANHNKAKYDRTRWFTLEFKNLGKLQSIAVLKQDSPSYSATGETQDSTRQTQNRTTIPETTTKTTTDRKASQLVVKVWNKYNDSKIKLTKTRESKINATLAEHSLKVVLYSCINLQTDEWYESGPEAKKHHGIKRLIDPKKRDANLDRFGYFPWSKKLATADADISRELAIEKKRRAKSGGRKAWAS